MPKKRKHTQAAILQQLTSAMQKVTVTNPKRKSRRRKRANNGQPSMVGGGPLTGDGTIRMKRTELVTSISVSTGQTSASGVTPIKPSSFMFLKNIANSFDRSRWNSMKFFYKPAVGTTFGGLVSIGVNWDYVTAATTREKVVSLTPSATTAAWQDSEKNPMVLPSNRLQSRLWYQHNVSDADIETGPGRLHWAATCTKTGADTVLGEIWVTYDIVMQGTNPI